MSLSSSSSSFDSATGNIQLYKSALGSFVNKQFAESVELIEPLLNSTPVFTEAGSISGSWTRLWNLYFAILNTAADQDHASSPKPNGTPLSSSGVAQGWTEERRQELASKLSSNKVWEQIIQSANDNIQNIPSQIVVSLISLSIKHSADLAPVGRLVETYLLTATDTLDPENPEQLKGYLRVVEAYSGDLLPAIQEYDLAAEFISNHPFFPEARKSQVLEKIKTTEVEQIKAANLRAEQEKERKQKLEQLEQERAKAAETARQLRELELQKIKEEKRQKEEERKLEALRKSNSTPLASTSGQADSNRDSSHLNTIWKNLRGYCRSLLGSSSTVFFLSLIVLLFVTSRPRVRQRLLQAWNKVVQTASMGMKVSYV